MTSLTEKLKNEIDAMSYAEMLRRWRHAPLGDPLFIAEIGAYFETRMVKLRTEIGPEAHVAASKEVGWNVGK